MELIYFIQVLLRRKWLILAITSIAVVATFLISRQTLPVYEAHVRLATGITEDTSSPVFSLEKSSSALKHEIEGKFRTMEESILSDPSLFLLGYQLMIHDLNKKPPLRSLTPLRTKPYSPEELQVLDRHLKRKRDSLTSLSFTDELERKHIESMRIMGYDPESLREKIFVRRVAGTDYIGIDARFETPELSAFAANKLAQEFSRYHVNTHAQVAEGSVDLLKKVAEEKRDDFNTKMRAWKTYENADEVEQVKNTTQNVIRNIERLEVERERSNKTIFDAEQQLTEAANALPQSANFTLLPATSRGPDNSEYLRGRLERLNYRYVRGIMQNPLLRDSIRITRDELAKILYTTASVRVPNASAETENLLRKKIDAEIQMEISSKRIKAISKEIRILSAEVGNLGAEKFTSTYGKEVQLARDAYLLSLNRLQDALILGGAPNLTIERVSQVEHVLPPQKPLPSKTLLLTVLAGIISLGLSISTIFLLEYLDRSIKHPARLQELTGLPILGSLNKLKNGNLDLVALFKSDQNIKNLENYKQLLRKIRHEISKEKKQNILITSPKEGSGKTSLMVSLAYSLSLNDSKVLLIDTNFKNHSLTDITAASPSLEKYLNKEISERALISGSVFEGVDVIGCQGGNYSPFEVFKNNEFPKLIAEMQKRYDYILMEGPSLNEFVDARELAPVASRVLPVFSADETLNSKDQEAISYLKSLDAKLMGAVLNKVDMRNLST